MIFVNNTNNSLFYEVVSYHHISSLTFPVELTKVEEESTMTPPSSTNLSLSPGLKAGRPL